MGFQLMFLLLKMCLILSSLSVHASAVPSSSQSSASLSIESKRHQIPLATPPNKYFGRSSHKGGFPTKAYHPYHNYAAGYSSIALPPRSSIRVPGKREASISASPPSRSDYTHRNKFINTAPQPSYLPLPPSHNIQVHPLRTALPPSNRWSLTAPAPAPTRTIQMHFPAHPASAPFITLPPPPPNEDCTTVTCTEPLTYAPPGSPCGCVLPIQVKLNLTVALYTFFPLVSELAKEIAASLPVEINQVRIMGANSVNHQQEKTTVIINLVPEGTKFNDNTAFLIYKKFWHRKVYIKTSLFGVYEVLYVRYPGLPPSPPTGPLDMAAIYDQQHHRGLDNNGIAMKPLGVDIPKRERNENGGSMTGVIVLSLFAALALSVGIASVFLLRCRASAQDDKILHPSDSPPAKTLGPKPTKSLPCNGSTQDLRHSSFASATLTYTRSAKVFTFKELKTATNKFDSSRTLGEGGFGIVYKGMLENEREVAVKVLKREDRHGDREFFAEVEMLSRLHHRNLVKLIGICAERNARCLVYELIPNGSVQSHLHGTDKMREPLDWDARMKIALGAARGLAYLHEDSSPCVIHRDFKSSNILLEHDFTPKVSDFGLARTALDEKHKYISTHVMGTFGYLAPEYAMTGHLLVKSDVYSYGVVLLELLTGRKPVDLQQPLGQENLVNWARPMLTSKEGLESIIDPAIKSSILFDSVAKVAAIASMCVQPEVSNRPFMGEVVQALKLVCNDFDEPEQPKSRIGNPENVLVEVKGRSSINSADLQKLSLTPSLIPDNCSDIDTREALSDSDNYMPSVCFEEQNLGSFRRDYNSEPLVGSRNRLLDRLRRLSGGSMSENRNPFKLWPGSY